MLLAALKRHKGTIKPKQPPPGSIHVSLRVLFESVQILFIQLSMAGIIYISETGEANFQAQDGANFCQKGCASMSSLNPQMQLSSVKMHGIL